MPSIEDTLSKITDASVPAAKQEFLTAFTQTKSSADQVAKDAADYLKQCLEKVASKEWGEAQFNGAIKTKRDEVAMWANTEVIKDRARTKALVLKLIDIALQQLVRSLIVAIA